MQILLVAKIGSIYDIEIAVSWPKLLFFTHLFLHGLKVCLLSVFVHIIFTSIWKNRRFGQRNRKDKDRNPFLNCDEIGFTRAVLGCSYASAYFKFEFKGWLSVYSQFWLKYIQIIHLKIQF